MNIRTRFLPVLAPAVLLCLSALPAVADAQGAADSRAEAPNLVAAPPGFSSALESYRRYTEEETLDWQKANAATSQAGGWRSYAREASGKSPDGPNTGESTKVNPHAGHGAPADKAKP